MKFFITIIAVFFTTISLHAASQEELHEGLKYKTRMEKLQEVSKFYGVSTELAKKFFRNVPDSFDTVSDGLRLAKIIDMFFTADDTEALVEIIMWDVEKIGQKLIEKNLPGVMPFYNAVGLYKDSLEIIRDYVYIPMMEDRIYQAYYGFRIKEAHVSDHEAVSLAFDMATMGPFSGYYTVRDSMLQKMARQMGYNQEILGPKFLTRIDAFWMRRMEAKFQQDLAKSKIPTIPRLAAEKNQSAMAIRQIEQYFDTKAYKKLSPEEKEKVKALALSVVKDLGGYITISDTPSDEDNGVVTNTQKPNQDVPTDAGLSADKKALIGIWKIVEGGQNKYLEIKDKNAVKVHVYQNGELVAHAEGTWDIKNGAFDVNLGGQSVQMKYKLQGSQQVIFEYTDGTLKKDVFNRVQAVGK